LALLAFAAANLRGQDTPGTLSLAPLNPDFVESLNNSTDAQRTNPQLPEAAATFEGYGRGYIPSPMDFSYLKSQPGLAPQAGAALPSSYDLRDYRKVSPVKNQLACGDCWAFGTYGSMESALLPNESWNFSENNLNNLSGFDYAPCMGGSELMSTAYLARWGGPIDALVDPDPTSCSSTSTCYNASPQNLPPAKHVQSVYFIAARASSTDNDNLKTAIMTYGGVAVTISAQELGGKNPYWNAGNASFYYDGAATADCPNSQEQPAECGTDHEVTLVGWDDNYPAGSFSTTPPGNGAFLVKNSWGSGFGANGFFWISYYDVRLAIVESYVFADNESTANYTTEYEYDPLGLVSSWGYGSNTAWFANIFTAAANGQVMAVATYAMENNSPYSIEIYTNASGGPTSGSLAATTSGTISLAGYNTIVLPSPVALTAGQKFSVVVKLTTPGYNYPIPSQYAISGYTSKATASPGRGYFSADGNSWQDATTVLSTLSIALKAFTNDQESNVALDGFTISPSIVPGNGSATLTITLNGAAPAGGAAVNSSSSNTSAFPVSSTYTVPAGQTSASFTSQAGTVTSPANVLVTASYNGSSLQAPVTVDPAAQPAMSGLAASPTTVLGGGVVNFAITLNGPAPAGGATVSLTSNNTSALPVPSSFNVPVGQTVSSFWVQAGTVTSSTSVAVTATYNGTIGQAMVTVIPAKITPTITWPTPAAITYGTALGATQLNATASVGGTFTYSPAAGTVLTAGQQVLNAYFTPTDTTDYNSTTATVTLTVNKATPTITWPTPAAITYGTALSSTQLNATASVGGTFSYSPSAGTVLAAGQQTLTANFTPTDTTDYNNATATITLTVNKATPTVSAWPAASTITYGQTLASSTLTGGSASVNGTFTWTTPSTSPGTGSQSESVTFTPADGTDNNQVAGSVSVTVNKATPTITWSTPAAITYGTALSSAQLNATASVGGTFSYTPSAGTVPAAGQQTLTANFTPTDTTDYNNATANVTLTVNKATPSVSAWPTASAITYGQTLASSTLTGGSASVNGTFAWTTPSTSPGAGNQSEGVTFTPADSTDNNQVTGSVSVTVNKATPTITWATPAAVTVGTALSSAQLDATASVPGTFAYSPAAGTVMSTAGNTTLSVTFTPTDSTDYNTATASVVLTVSAAILPPAATTSGATAVTANSATLNGQVTSNGADTHVWFLYGTSSTLSGASQTPSQDIGSAASGATFSASISGLSGSSTYYFQAVAQNSSGTTSGSILSFTTAAAPTFTVAGTSVSLSKGASTGNTSTITVTPSGGFTGTVTLSAAITSSPAGAQYLPTFNWTPSNGQVSITGTSAATAALIIVTTPATVGANELPVYPGSAWRAATGTMFACILLVCIPVRRRSLRNLLGLVALFVALIGGVTACGGGNNVGGGGGGGGGNSGTTSGSYTITVTGTSGSASVSAPISLTVQ
jgi:C1A family cysteine protease